MHSSMQKAELGARPTFMRLGHFLNQTVSLSTHQQYIYLVSSQGIISIISYLHRLIPPLV